VSSRLRALETLPRLRVIGLRVRSRLLLSVEIKSASSLDLGRVCKLEDGEGAALTVMPLPSSSCARSIVNRSGRSPSTSESCRGWRGA
jgi:hypothetical protein